MSAVTWESMGAPALEPARPARRRLVSVPTGADVVELPLGRIRPTRTGRLAVTLGVALLAATVAGWSLVGPARGPESGSVVTVHAGQTLSGIVAAELPGLDPAVAVAEVVALNDLPSAQLGVGQVLILPKH